MTPSSRSWAYRCVLLALPFLIACQTFDAGLRRKIDRIDVERVDASRVAFDHDALQVEVTCRDGFDKCTEWAGRTRTYLVDILGKLEAARKLEPKYPARLRVQVRMTQWWNVLNLIVYPMVFGIPLDMQTAAVDVDLDYNGRVFHSEGTGFCASSSWIARGPEGSSGCALGEGVADAVNAALDAGIAASKEAP
jgi:hypothetical protein